MAKYRKKKRKRKEKERRSLIGSRRTSLLSLSISHLKGRNVGDLSSYLVDGSLKDLAFVSLARAHVRGGNQLGKLVDKQVLLVPSSFFVKALVTVNNQN